MPFMKKVNGKSVRDYRREVDLYTSKPAVKKKRAEQNAARAEMVKSGANVKGKDVDHIKPLSKGGTNAKSNLRAVAPSANRSFSRNSNGSLKSQTSSKERKKK